MKTIQMKSRNTEVLLRRYFLPELFILLVLAEILGTALIAAIDPNISSIKNEFISSNFTNNAAGKYYELPDSNPAVGVNGIAVFLLGTMKGATQLGVTDRGGQHVYYERSVSARLTWARHAKVFYIVTGRANDEDKAFRNPNACRNNTEHMRKVVGNFHPKPRSFEVYRCGKAEEEVNVLHIPRCTGEYAGPQGPCCRCEAAMMFYSALQKAHVASGHSHGFPQWFVFADDDYFIRLNYLEAVLDNPATPADRPYALVSSTGFDEHMKSVNEKRDTERPNFGLFRHDDGKCRVPCVHRVPWMGWGGYSLGAIRLMEQSTLNDEGLINVCVRWEVTHDIGLGIYTWMHSIQMIDIKLGPYNGFKNPQDYNREEIHWHKPWGNGIKVDELWSIILTDGNTNAPFDLKKYVEKEKELGKKYLKDRNRLVPSGSFKNTMFARRVAYYQELAVQVQESQRTAAMNLSVTDYVPKMCTEDKNLFEAWEKANNKWAQAKHNDHGVLNGQPQECLEYTEYIHNQPVNVTEKDLPPLDDLIRRKYVRTRT